jgi:hypothetical protein
LGHWELNNSLSFQKHSKAEEMIAKAHRVMCRLQVMEAKDVIALSGPSRLYVRALIGGKVSDAHKLFFIVKNYIQARFIAQQIANLAL